MLGQREGREDKKRLCPACRMEISVLAVKCMYCGEKVGRPQAEQRTMTVNDLGGESGMRYAPSSSVMEALESFRVEETLDSGLWGEDALVIEGIGSQPSDPGAATGTGAGTGLPELDERSKALASVALPSQSVSSIRKKKPVAKSDWKKKAMYAVGGIVGVCVLYIAGMQVYAMMQSKEVPRPTAEYVPPNPAEKMLENGAPPLEILKAAVLAVKENDIPKNREILEEARARLIDMVQKLLNADPFDQKNISRASKVTEEAVMNDSHPSVVELKREVEQESQAHVMAFRFDGDTAKLTTYAGGQEKLTTVQEGDDVGAGGRFKVSKITKDAVRLKDTRRNGRNVQVMTDGQLTAW